jgi:tetratricopeptide (TPR) repeat protein
VDAACIQGVCCIQAKDYNEARVAFARMLVAAFDSAPDYILTELMLLRRVFRPPAEGYARDAEEIAPELILTEWLLGGLHLFRSKIPQAPAEFQRELAINTEYVVLYYTLADADSRIQKYDAAEKFQKQSIWLDAVPTEPCSLLGKVPEKRGETRLAVRDMQRTLRMGPSNPILQPFFGQS